MFDEVAGVDRVPGVDEVTGAAPFDWRARRGPLRGLRVLVAGRSVSAQILAGLFADWGADTVLLEPAEGHPARHALTGDERSSLAWKARSRNTRSVAVDITDAAQATRVATLLTDAADVVIDDTASVFAEIWGPHMERIRERAGSAVTVEISAYGASGPRRDLPADEVVAEAFAGLAFITGDPAREPLHSDYPVGAAVTALMGAVSAMAALYRRDHSGDSGPGGHIDLATSEALLRILDFVIVYRDQLGWVVERTDSTSPYQVPVNRWRTADGVWMSFTGNTQDVVARFIRAIGHPELVDDERFATNAARVENKDTLEAIIAEYFAGHTHAEIDTSMEEHGVPIAAILSMAELFVEPQYRVRGSITSRQDATLGSVDLPNAVVRFSRTPAGIDRLGPDLGADAAGVLEDWSTGGAARIGRSGPEASDPAASGPDTSDPDAAGAPPLTGLRVIDNANVLAGPLCATLLADLGADVIKAERPVTGDLFRMQAPLKDGVSVWWKVMGRGTGSIALDLKDSSDRETFLRLVDRADVVIENFVPGVAASIGVDADTLLSRNPRVVPVRISGYGQEGPMSRRRAFGRNAEAYSGMAFMTGYPGSLPQHTGFPVADAFSGLFAAFGALAAIYERDTLGSGHGQALDIALFESVFRFMEPQVALYGKTGEVWERGVASTEPGLWRRVIPTSDGKWVSMSANSRTALARVAEWVGVEVDTLLDPALDLSVFGTTRTAEQLAAAAAERGIACAPVSTIADVMDSDQLAARGMLVTVADPDLGDIRMPAVVPMIDGGRLPVRRPAPQLDGDREAILSEWLGVSV